MSAREGGEKIRKMRDEPSLKRYWDSNLWVSPLEKSEKMSEGWV